MTQIERVFQYVASAGEPIEPRDAKRDLPDIPGGTVSTNLSRLVDQGRIASYQGRYFVPEIHTEYAMRAAAALLRGVKSAQIVTDAPASDAKRRALEGKGTRFGETTPDFDLVDSAQGPIKKTAEIPGIRHEAYGKFLFGFNLAIYQRANGPIVIDWTGDLPEPGISSEGQGNDEPKA